MMSKERFLSALKGQHTDRIPVVPKIWVDFAARVAGVSILNVIEEPLTALRVIAIAGEKLGFDAVRQFHFYPRRLLRQDDEIYEINTKGEKLGAIDIYGGLSTKLFDKKYYNISDPVMMACPNWLSPEPVVNTVEEAKAIAVPGADVFDSLDWGKNQNVIINEFGKDLCIIGDCGSATMSYYINFRGLERAMFDLIENPKLVYAVMEKGVQSAIARGKYWLDLGITVLRLNDSTGNMTLMSPAHWREFVYPHIKTVCDELHNYNKDALVYCHICGNILPIIELLVEAGLDCIGPLDPLGGFSVRQARKKAGNSVSLMGGVNTLTLLEGSPEQVKQEALKCMQEAGDKGGFILGSGCAVPRNCPEENLISLVKAAVEFSKNKKIN